MAWKLSRTLGAVAAFAAAFGVSGPGLAQTQTEANQLGEDDFLLLQPVVGGYKLTADVRGYQTDQGICLDLADIIQSLDLPVRLDKKSRRATGWLFAEDQTITIDRSSNTVQIVNRGAKPIGDAIYDTPEGWCVDTKALSAWTGVEFKPDLYNSVVKLVTDREMPFMQAIERRSRAARLRPKTQSFDLAQYPHAEMEYKLWRTPSVDVVAQAGYESDRTRGNRRVAKLEAYAAGEIGKASYFARVATDNDLKPDSLRLRAYRHDADGKLLGPLKATQVAVGDVQSLSGQLTGESAVGRGAFISNQPLAHRARFAETSLRGVLPAGWDAELYRNGQLIAFQGDNGDGRYEFLDIDLFYGRNELEVVLYGPQGQIRRETSSQPVGLENIEPGKTYYWAGILQDDRDLIDLRRNRIAGPHEWRWGGGVERGIDKRTSIGVGLQSFWYNGRRRNYAETTLWRTVGPVMMEFSGAHEFGGGSIAQVNALGQVGKINFGAHVAKGIGNFQSEQALDGLRHEIGAQIDMSFKLGSLSIPLQLSGRRAELRDGGKVDNLSVRTALTTRVMAIAAEFDHESRSVPGPGGDFERNKLRLLANSRIFGLRLRGNAAFDLSGPDKGFEYARLTAEKRLTERSDLAAEVEYLAREDATRFSLGYSRYFDRFALRTDASVATNGAVGAHVSVAFSFGPDPLSGGVRFSGSKLARSGQAAVTVFRDDNGDGVRSAGEELLPEVQIEAGMRGAGTLTDDKGQAIVDDLRPFIPVLVGIDESTLEDPFLAPAIKGVVVVPRPGIAARIELPVAPSGEVEGVLLNLAGLEIGGVELELIDRAGRTVGTAYSEFDGFFLFQRVPYGEYRLRVARDSARTLGAEQSLAGALVVNRDSDVARLGAVKLAPARGSIAAAGDDD
ncbi:carboxypeptidase-like regulatory domain-containing protein [Qipengyuania oceanensis]|uniref:Carboxypeptidase regulatory-like domain-containing protein n=1 Tax=Qipengyuania oceanensis TaxID=1463597 RepID=A0A844YDB7_9SPHN|nr:carboxypeptidase-like regulatory domain-containing protein [Qipengyuania oceanensis]MXO63056.1 carboxypeptidase regulatory-like domain-containing protein [Qipengyuania oceanensis]